MEAVIRPSGREPNHLRNISFSLGFSKHAEGSCLVKFGDTHVICTATVENQVPGWLRGSGAGWVTSEYGMLPRSTSTRMKREASRGKQSGRTFEIQRLIGRSLRAVVDLKLLGELQIRIDCDVLQADGGTRTASVSGAYLAMHQACHRIVKEKIIPKNPIIEPVSAVSCGLYNGTALLDLNYLEDSQAEVDANFVITASGKIVEIQSTAENKTFSQKEFNTLFELAKLGCIEISKHQIDELESSL